MAILIYTFRTFPDLDELKNIFQDVVVLGKLKKDLQNFYQLILDKKPDLILGIALSKGRISFFEQKTINKFNKNTRIIKGEKKELSLFIPILRGFNFKISTKVSNSFCNYSMYKIKYFLEKNKIKIPFAFVHIKKEQIKELSLLLNS